MQAGKKQCWESESALCKEGYHGVCGVVSGFYGIGVNLPASVPLSMQNQGQKEKSTHEKISRLLSSQRQSQTGSTPTMIACLMQTEPRSHHASK